MSNWLEEEESGWGLEELGLGAEGQTLAEALDDDDRLLHEVVDDADVPSFLAGGELLALPVPEVFVPSSSPSSSPAPVVSAPKRARGGDQRLNHGGKGWSTCYACPRALSEPYDQHNTENTEEMCEHLAEKRGERWEPSAKQLLKADERSYEEVREPCPSCRSHQVTRPSRITNRNPTAGGRQGGARAAAQSEALAHLPQLP